MAKADNFVLKEDRVQFYISLFKTLQNLSCVKSLGVLKSFDIKLKELVSGHKGMSVKISFVKGTSLSSSLDSENPTYILFKAYDSEFVCFKGGNDYIKGDTIHELNKYRFIVTAIETCLDVVEREMDVIPEDISSLCLKMSNESSSLRRFYNPNTDTVICEMHIFKDKEV